MHIQPGAFVIAGLLPVQRTEYSRAVSLLRSKGHSLQVGRQEMALPRSFRSGLSDEALYYVLRKLSSSPSKANWASCVHPSYAMASLEPSCALCKAARSSFTRACTQRTKENNSEASILFSSEEDIVYVHDSISLLVRWFKLLHHDPEVLADMQGRYDTFCVRRSKIGHFCTNPWSGRTAHLTLQSVFSAWFQGTWFM